MNSGRILQGLKNHAAAILGYTRLDYLLETVPFNFYDIIRRSLSDTNSYLNSKYSLSKALS